MTAVRSHAQRAKNRTARVSDLTAGERLPDHQTGDGDPSLSSLLMTSLGLRSDMRAASRAAGSGNAGTRITFADVLTFLYVRQAEINRDIAHSQDSYREPKRKACAGFPAVSSVRGGT